MQRDVGQPRAPRQVHRVDRRHPARRKPARARGDEDEQERGEERRNRQEHQRHAADQRGPGAAAAAGDDAERDAEESGNDERHHCQRRRVGRGAANQRADRAVVEKGAAEVEAHRSRHPERPLRQRTAVEIELRARACHFGRRREGAELVGDITRREPGQEEGGRRDGEDEEDREEEAADEKSGHWLTLRLSAFHSTGGRCTDGTTPRRRALCA